MLEARGYTPFRPLWGSLPYVFIHKAFLHLAQDMPIIERRSQKQGLFVDNLIRKIHEDVVSKFCLGRH